MPMILEADEAINPDPDYKPYRPTSEEVGTFLTTELRAAADALPVDVYKRQFICFGRASGTYTGTNP